MTLQDESGRTGFITKTQFRFRMGLAQFGEELVHAVQVAGNAAVMAHLGTGFRDGDGDVLRMDIQPDVDY